MCKLIQMFINQGFLWDSVPWLRFFFFLNTEAPALLILDLCYLRKSCNLTLTHRTQNKMSSDCRTTRLWASKSLNQSEGCSPHRGLCPSPACFCQVSLGSWCLTWPSGKNRLIFTSWKRDLSLILMFVHVSWGCWWGAHIFKNQKWMHTLATCNHDKASIAQAWAWFFKVQNRIY